MEKRFIGFVAASVAIMAAFMLWQQFLGPQPKPVAKRPIPLADKKIGKKGEDKKAEKGEKKPPDGEAEKPKPKKPAAPQIPQEWMTLGSLDPNSPSRVLVTLTNQGGAVERIELNSKDYFDLEVWSGYLGHLALSSVEGGGCQVNVVGAGTPAALATASAAGVKPGLLKGDVILALNDESFDTPEEFDELLGETKPDQTAELTVSRKVAGQPTKLTFTVELIHKPLDMVSPEKGSTNDPLEPHPLSLLLTLHSLGPAGTEESAEQLAKIKRGENEIDGLPSLLNGRWQTKLLTGDLPGVEFRYLLEEDALREIGQSGKLEVVKRYRLAQTPDDQIGTPGYKSYHLEFEVEIVNLGKEARQIAYRLQGPTGLPLEGWWYQNKIHPHMWAAAGARDVVWKTPGWKHALLGCPLIYDNAVGKKQTPMFPANSPVERRRLEYAGVDAQYFTSALVPYDTHEEVNTTYDFEQAEALPALLQKDKAGRKVTNVTFQLTSLPSKLEPGESFKHSFLFFAGPKDLTLLRNYGLEKTVEYGWFPWVAWPLSQLLHFFHYGVGNYGLAIIMLTLLVRGCMLPIGLKMAKNMQAMQDLAPELKAVKEKYKDDLAKQGKAQQELMRKHGVNPYAGCLPLFLQMPIFIGLYRALSVDIGLRQAPLIPGIHWSSNLAGPDQLWHWTFWPDMIDGEFGYLGPYLNVFPLVTAGLFLLQQKLFTPPPTDEQQEMQQKMMKYMTVFMSIMFFKVPAGLCLYFITSSLWGIAERTLMMPKKKSGGNATVKTTTKKLPDKPGSNGATHKEEKSTRKSRDEQS